MPAQTRESAFSREASEKLVNERVIPGNGGPLVMLQLIWSVSKKRANTAEAAPPATLWVDG